MSLKNCHLYNVLFPLIMMLHEDIDDFKTCYFQAKHLGQPCSVEKQKYDCVMAFMKI